jgi:hypothetical protein
MVYVKKLLIVENKIAVLTGGGWNSCRRIGNGILTGGSGHYLNCQVVKCVHNYI